MTENEAIEGLKTDNALLGESELGTVERNEVAIKALEEIQQYRAIGTVAEFEALKEKSVAKKPRWHGHHFCPNCNSIVYVNGGKDICCPKCGQRLDWSE